MLFKRSEKNIDKDELVKSLVAYIFNDQKLSMPVYLNEIQSEQDADSLGLYPVIYIWNECRDTGSFSVSINTKPIAHLLEGHIPRSHSNFNQVRDKVASILSNVSQSTVISTCQKVGAYPSDVFA